MKNTGITYTSAERSPVILPEMAELLPPLSAEQLDALEADLIKNGCYSPIIVNEDMVIIDGHNRQALCEKHGLPYTMAVFSFEDMLEAKQWALDTQKGRRNLEKWELGKIALKLKPEIEAKARANQSAAGGDKFSEKPLSATLPEAVSAVDTRKELAEAVGLGERTMGKVIQIDENAPDAIKEALDKKELSINKGYDLTRQLQDVPEDQREQAAAELLEYPYQVHRILRHTFAHRKTAVQVSPYGGRLFICRTSRCVCRCGPASAPEHHLLCGRQAASPGECDIPDGLPNRRTGHGHGSYPAAVRPLPAMLRPAPAVRSSSHA